LTVPTGIITEWWLSHVKSKSLYNLREFLVYLITYFTDIPSPSSSTFYRVRLLDSCIQITCLNLELLFCKTGAWTRGLALARQALHSMRHTSSPDLLTFDNLTCIESFIVQLGQKFNKKNKRKIIQQFSDRFITLILIFSSLWPCNVS
jgi:hypothetical protein